MKRWKRIVAAALTVAATSTLFTGCGKGTGTENSSETIKIGSIHPLTGNYAYEAQSLVNAQNMAIEEINNAGGIQSFGGRKLELVVGDSQGKADTGASETQRLINENVVALTGTFQSGVTQTCMQEAEKSEVPFVVTVSNNVAMFEKGFQYCFRIQPNANVFSNDFIQYIKAVKTDSIKTAVLINEDSITGTESGDVIAKNLTDAGITLLDRISYSAATATLSSEVTKLAEVAPDMLITIGYFNDTSLLVKELSERNITFKLVVGVANGGISDNKFIKDFGSKVENFCDVNYRYNPNDQKARQVLASYKEKYGEDMSVHAIYGYESIKVLADSLERAGSTDSEKLRDAIADTDYKDTILAQNSSIKFDEKGENVNAAGVMVQIQNGVQKVVFPEEFAESSIIIGN